MNERWSPRATVAAIIERDGRFLLVEEHTPEGLRLNNPAGHLEPFESPEQACVREVLEETAHAFTPTALVGIYLSRFQRPAVGDAPAQDISFLRFAYGGTVGEALVGHTLDSGIVRALWLSADEIRASAARHRSPMVVQCMEDYLRGQRWPLGAVHTDASVYFRE